MTKKIRGLTVSPTRQSIFKKKTKNFNSNTEGEPLWLSGRNEKIAVSLPPPTQAIF
jgi:hypothetical protein